MRFFSVQYSRMHVAYLSTQKLLETSIFETHIWDVINFVAFRQKIPLNEEEFSFKFYFGKMAVLGIACDHTLCLPEL